MSVVVTLVKVIDGIEVQQGASITFDFRIGQPGVGVPSGGNTGEILQKKSNNPYDTEWVQQGSASVTKDNVGTAIDTFDVSTPEDTDYIILGGKKKTLISALKTLFKSATDLLYEPIITKLTAFNKNFGTTAGTILEGRTFGTAANNNTGDFATADQGAKADTALQTFTETDPTVPAWSKNPTKPTYNAGEVGAEPANSNIQSHISDTIIHVTSENKTNWDGKVDTTDTRLSDARNAADVYAWAKETTKPSYTLDELSDVVSTAPNVDDNLQFDGLNWVPRAGVIGAGNGIIEYLTDTDSPDVTDANYLYLARSPITLVETSFAAAVTSGTSPVVIKNFIISSNGIGVTTIPAGLWEFNTWAKSSGGTTSGFDIVVYAATVSAGVVTLGSPLFTVANKLLTNVITGYNVNVIQTAFSGLTIDHRLVFVYRATQTLAQSRTVTIYLGGSANASHAHTPLQSRHNDLAGINDGDYIHLTAAQVSSVNDITNKVPYTGANADVNLGNNNIIVDTNLLVTDKTNKKVVIGNTAYSSATSLGSSKFNLFSADSANKDILHAFFGASGNAILRGARAKGTIAVPTNLTGNNNILYEITALAYYSAWRKSASFYFAQDGTWAAGTYPTCMVFAVNSPTSSTAPVDYIKLGTNGALSSMLANYETLVTSDNVLVNKKFVDDLLLLYAKINNSIFTGIIQTPQYEYKNPTSTTADTIGDRREYVLNRIKYFQRCTVSNATKGGGTWVTDLFITSTGQLGINGTNETYGAKFYLNGGMLIQSGGYISTLTATSGFSINFSTVSGLIFRLDTNDIFKIDTSGNLIVTKSIKVGDDTAAATQAKAGSLRYRDDANNSYVEMCVRNGASSYIWKIINQETW